MSLEEKITAALSAIPQLLVGGEVAVYQDEFPQPLGGAAPVWPAVRFIIIGGTVYEDICGDGDGDGDDVRAQIDIVCNTTAERAVLVDAVRAAMKTLDPPAVLQGRPAQERDAETKTYRAMGDWMIHGSAD